MDIFENPIFKLELTVWVFIPIYNFEKFLDQCFRSLKSQTYKNYKVVIVDDGSTDGSFSIINKWYNLINGNIIKNERNMGCGFTKWQAVEFVRKNGSACDIFTILDGDDFYTSVFTLHTIVLSYLKNKCLFTYGSAEGLNTDQASLVTELSTLRKPTNRFKFQHPRSCQVCLLNNFTESDFKDSEGSWLIRVTDRQFIYKCIELSGLKRVSYIKKILYSYRTHSHNIRNLVDENYKNRIIDQIAKKAPSKVLEDEIHIVMCCYKRHHNLLKIIESISLQTIKNIKIHFHIVNTNPEKWEETLLLKDRIWENVVLHLCNTNSNLYGYARFLYVKKLMKTTYIPYVIFIDDDQYLPAEWLEMAWSSKHPLTYCCWYGRIFENEKGVEGLSYWNDKIPQHKRLLAKYDAKYKEFDYGATCGCIIDTSFFLFDIVFKCPKEYRNIEDLWLSFIVKHILGKPINIMINPIAHNMFNDTESTALWPSLMTKKEEFLKLLAKTGYCFSNKINITELLQINTSDNDSDESINNFIII